MDLVTLLAAIQAASQTLRDPAGEQAAAMNSPRKQDHPLLGEALRAQVARPGNAKTTTAWYKAAQLRLAILRYEDLCPINSTLLRINPSRPTVSR